MERKSRKVIYLNKESAFLPLAEVFPDLVMNPLDCSCFPVVVSETSLFNPTLSVDLINRNSLVKFCTMVNVY